MTPFDHLPYRAPQLELDMTDITLVPVIVPRQLQLDDSFLQELAGVLSAMMDGAAAAFTGEKLILPAIARVVVQGFTGGKSIRITLDEHGTVSATLEESPS